MSGVKTYKALDYHMMLYGFWPGDLAVVAVLFILIHGVFNSLLLDLCVVGPALFFAWRARRRSPLFGAFLLSFVLIPQRYNVGLAREESRR
jgi:hypothetical protein